MLHFLCGSSRTNTWMATFFEKFQELVIEDHNTKPGSNILIYGS